MKNVERAVLFDSISGLRTPDEFSAVEDRLLEILADASEIPQPDAYNDFPDTEEVNTIFRSLSYVGGKSREV